MKNTLEVDWDGRTYVFVLREDDNVTPEEAMKEALFYLKTRHSVEVNKLEIEPLEHVPFIPDTKDRQRMFLNDVQLGMEFCAAKYGVSKASVLAEARRIAPHFNFKEERG